MMADVDSGDVSRIAGTLSPRSAVTANTIVLCNDKHHARAKYALAGMGGRPRTAQSLFELPQRVEMQRFIYEPLREDEE